MLFMTLYAFRIIFVHKILNFMHFSQKHYIHTDGPTDGPTNGRTHPLIEMRGRFKKVGGVLIRVGALDRDYTVVFDFFLTKQSVLMLFPLCLL